MHKLTAAITAALVVVGAGSSAVRADGNSDAAHACQKGGYLTLIREDGTTFRNTGDCASYAADGGVLRPATASAVLSDIVLSADNALTAGYELDGVQHVVASKAAVRGTVTVPDVTIGPFPTGTALRVFLRDDTCGATYYSDGDHARVVGANPYEIDIADAGPGCSIVGSPWLGSTGTSEGNLSLRLTVD
jgi:hypothetical protein